MGLTTLKRRADFLPVRGGLRWSMPALVVEAKPRSADLRQHGQEPEGARFGFTVTKKIGKAVVRNRLRRRLKSAVREISELARPDFDYVVIARAAAIDRPFADLKSDLTLALTRIHRTGARSSRAPA